MKQYLSKAWRGGCLVGLTIVFTFSLSVCSDEEEKDVSRDSGPDGVADAVEDQPVLEVKTPDLPEQDVPPPEQGIDVLPDMAVSKYWKEVYKPGYELNDVMGTSSTDVYAVGKSGLIVKYNGSYWGTMTNPDTDKTELTVLWTHSGNSYLWAMGHNLVLYLVGSTWSSGYKNTSSSYYYYNFEDVWGTGSYLWGVGEMSYYMSYKSSLTPTSSWSSISLGSSTLTDSMYGIWGASSSELYAVGDKGTIFKCSGTCASTSSSYWSKMTNSDTSNLRGIWGISSTSGSTIFAVGFDGVVLKGNGSSWTKMTTNTKTYFNDVWGTSETNVYAVGQSLFQPDEAVFRYDGTQWTKLPTPKSYVTLNAIWGSSATEIWAVGNSSILQYIGN